MTGMFFDDKGIERRFGKKDVKFEIHALLAQRVVERLEEIREHPENVLDLSFDNSALAGLVKAKWPLARVVQDGYFEEQFGTILSHLCLPLVDDVPTFVANMVNKLTPNGYFLATTLGSESFCELKGAFEAAGLGASGHVIPLTDVRELGGLLQRLKVAMPVVDRDVITLTFANFDTLLARLTDHAARNYNVNRAKGLMTPRMLNRVAEAYADLYLRPDGRLPLTLEMIYLHGWKPAVGQPQALKPGSGKISLVKILQPEGEEE